MRTIGFSSMDCPEPDDRMTKFRRVSRDHRIARLTLVGFLLTQLLCPVTPFLCPALVLASDTLRPQPASEGKSRTGLEEALRPEGNPAAGMEESSAAELHRIFEAAGLPDVEIAADVLRDPALWRDGVREIPRLLQQRPVVLEEVAAGKGAVQIGWGLQLELETFHGEPRFELVPLKAGKENPYAPLQGWVLEELWAGARSVQATELRLDENGVWYRTAENQDWQLLPALFLPRGTWLFLSDRKLELLLSVPLPDGDAWRELVWLLDPRTLRLNIPPLGSKGAVQSPVRLRGPGGRLQHLRGHVDAVETMARGRSRPLRFQVRSAGPIRRDPGAILGRTKAEVLLHYWREGGALRPGPFGWNRPAIERLLNEWFGPDGWELVHLVEGRPLSKEEALGLYEEAYYVYFRDHPEELEELIRSASDVYDTALSNRDSGTDYARQETAAEHLQDIAIRRVIQRLGRRFQGPEPLRIRGPRSAGFRWNPGKVPFHRPELILQPALSGWWEPGSIEDFYQSSRRLVLRSPARDAVSAFIRSMTSFIYRSMLSMEEVRRPFWLLPPEAFPRDEQGRPRAFTESEIRRILRELSEGFIASYEFLPGRFRGRGEMQAMQAIPAVLESNRRVIPDVEFIRSHVRHLPALWDAIRGRHSVPILLARDSLTVYEFGAYQAAVRGEPFQAHLIYQPGAPRESVSVRARDPVLDHTLKKTSAIWTDVVDLLRQRGILPEEAAGDPARRDQIYREFRGRFDEGVEQLLREDPTVAVQASHLYRQFASANLPDGAPLLVVDTNAYGRTALFVASVIQRKAAEEGRRHTPEVLLGWARRKSVGIPELADEVEQVVGEPFHDLHWPFRYEGTDPESGEPVFAVTTNLAKLLLMAYQSMEIYNAAVGDTAGMEEVRAAEERVRATLHRLVSQPASRVGKQAVVVGPTIYRDAMPFLPALVEGALGELHPLIFFDPQIQGMARGELLEARAGWAAGLYGREIASATFLGSDAEFSDFQPFARHAGISVEPARDLSLADPVRFVVDLLKFLGVPLPDTGTQLRQQLDKELGLLIAA